MSAVKAIYNILLRRPVIANVKFGAPTTIVHSPKGVYTGNTFSN
jgi:hypothetical protein